MGFGEHLAVYMEGYPVRDRGSLLASTHRKVWGSSPQLSAQVNMSL